MGIQVSSNVVQPEITFDKIHLLKLEITQPTFENNELPPKYKVFIEYKLFGVDGANRRYYHPEIQEVEIQDYVQYAMDLMNRGDFLQVTAFQSIEKAIAAIISKDAGLEAQVI